MCQRKLLPFIGGLLLGALAMHFVELTDRNSIFTAAAKKAAPDGIVPGSPRPLSAEPNQSPTSSPHGKPAKPAMDIPGELYRRVRILCLIVTHPGNYHTKAVMVNNTWASRCNTYIFVGTNDTKVAIPLMRLNISDVYTNLWQKVWMAFEYADRKFNLDNFDYVLKADDDTYVIMENVRLLLLPQDPNQPIHLGRQFYYDRDEKQQYMSGGAGYVFSRAAVKLFLQRIVRSGVKVPACDLERRVSEDWMVGVCMTSLGVKLVKSLDSNGLERFHPLNPEYMIGHGAAEMPKWMWNVNYYKFQACLRNCVSPVTTTFHYVHDMYLLEFLLYGMRPIGVDPAANEAVEVTKMLSG